MLFGGTNSPFRPLEDEIKNLAATGVDYLEICLDPPQASPEILRPKIPMIKRVLEGEGLQLLVAHLPTFVWLADIYPGIREASAAEVVKTLEISAELGIKKAVLHPGYLTGLMTFLKDYSQKASEESLSRILEKAGEFGLTICLENLFPRAGQMYLPQEFTEVLEKFPDLMMTLDLAHANIKAPRERMKEMIQAGGARIRHVHLADNNGQEDDHLPVGAGRADLAGGLAALKAMGYDETITLEVFSPDREYLAMSLSKVKAMWDKA
ncbi:MAG: sugar phosphate isomerase/epimerase family protein [Pseudomonadota bacterium]